MVETILKDETNPANRTLADALAQAGFLKDGKPNVAAVRVPMESEYRDFWELPYEPIVKTKLAFWLVQARAMLEIGRAAGREGGCQYVWIPVVDVSLKKKQDKHN